MSGKGHLAVLADSAASQGDKDGLLRRTDGIEYLMVGIQNRSFDVFRKICLGQQLLDVFADADNGFRGDDIQFHFSLSNFLNQPL